MDHWNRDSPFDELTALVKSLRSSCVPASGHTQSEVDALFSSIEQWAGNASERRARSESIIAYARDAVISIDDHGTIIEWNLQAEQLTGWTREEIIGRPLSETIVPEQYRDSHKAGMVRFQRTGMAMVTNQRLEMSALRRDGSEFPAELTVLDPVRIGDTYVFNAFLRDLTRRKQATEALQASEALYHSLVDRLPFNVTRKGADGRITFVNRPFTDLVKKDAGELIGKTDFDLFPEKLARKYRDDDLRVLESGSVLRTIEANESSSGRRFFEVWKVPVRDGDGNVVETQAVFWDITEREQTREALARERDLLRTLMDSLPDLVYVKDNEGRFVTVNRAMLQLWGCDDDTNIAGRTAFDFASPELAAQYAAEDQEVFDSGEALLDREEEVVDGQGVRHVYSTSKVPLRGPDGTITGLVGVDRNITNRKRNEEALQESQRVANAANAAKSNFLANMSHEIRTPMGAIIGMTDLVLESELNHTQRDYLRIVSESAEALLTIINQILDFSKIEAGKLTLETIPFDLRHEIGSVLKSLGIRAHNKGLELGWYVDRDVPVELAGDVNRLRQVLVNLIGNAIKFTEHGEIVVTVRLLEMGSKERPHQIQFDVQDTGIGIPTHKQESIFKEFEQADMSTTREFGGTGLGLSITSHIIEAMGGRIWLTSEVDVGTTFHFTVALDSTPEPVPERLATPHLPSTVILVSRQHRSAELMAQHIKDLGPDVHLAHSPEDAVALISTSSQTESLTVISDVDLGKTSGFDLTDHLRRLEEYSRIPVILLASAGRKGDLARCEQLRISSQILKPPRHSELLDALSRAMGLPHAQAVSSDASNTAAIDALKILIVEDGHANRTLARGLLSKWGHHSETANDGESGVQKMLNSQYDAVLMDVQMPVMDGLDATRKIRELESGTGRRTPIIAVTARAMPGDRERCINAGMDDYISKPIRRDELQEALARVLSGRAESS